MRYESVCKKLFRFFIFLLLCCAIALCIVVSLYTAGTVVKVFKYAKESKCTTYKVINDFLIGSSKQKTQFAGLDGVYYFMDNMITELSTFAGEIPIPELINYIGTIGQFSEGYLINAPEQIIKKYNNTQLDSANPETSDKVTPESLNLK